MEDTAKTHEYYLKLAYQLAEKAALSDEVPVGAVVVSSTGTVVSSANNLKESHKQPHFHAELLAIEKACKAVGDWRLNGHTLYTTLEPCIMCSGAILHARLDRVVFGAKDFKWGGAGSLTNLFSLETNHKTETIYVEDEKCSAILKKFFKKKRIG